MRTATNKLTVEKTRATVRLVSRGASHPLTKGTKRRRHTVDERLTAADAALVKLMKTERCPHKEVLARAKKQIPMVRSRSEDITSPALRILALLMKVARLEIRYRQLRLAGKVERNEFFESSE